MDNGDTGGEPLSRRGVLSGRTVGNPHTIKCWRSAQNSVGKSSITLIYLRIWLSLRDSDRMAFG